MILKETKFWITDNSGAVKTKCIHLYKPQTSQLGNFVKNVLTHFDTKKKLVKKKKYMSLILSTAQKRGRKHGGFVRFNDNRGILLLDYEKFLGSRIYGPVTKELKLKIDEPQFKKYKSMASMTV